MQQKARGNKESSHRRSEQAQGREQRLLDDLRRHLESAERSLWAAGRIINELKRRFGYQTKELAHLFPQTSHRLDEIAATARVYTKSLRNNSLTFYAHEVARRAARRAAIGIGRHFGTKIDAPYERALTLADQVKHRSGVLAVQQLTRTILEEERSKREPKRLSSAARLSAANATLLSQMHHADCRSILGKVAAQSVKLLHIDPPYASYTKTDHGVMKKSVGAVAFACDSNDREESHRLTADLLKQASDLLVENGVVALWQAASGLPASLARAIEEHGLIHHPFLIWDRGFVQLGDPSMGVMYSTEVCYLLTRRGEHPLANQNGERGQVIRTDRESHRAADFTMSHLMQKPAVVNEELVRRFTSEGDIIVDVCGCSASMCIAAHRLGRRWMYCESNAQNFALGKRNMEDHLVAHQSKTA